MNFTENNIARLASFPEQNPNPVIEIDLKTAKVNYMNPAAISLFPEVMEHHLEHQLFSIINTKINSKTDFQCEVLIDEHVFEQKIYFIPDTDLIRVYSHDLTEHKKTEKNLSRLASFPEQNPSPIIEIDIEGTITYKNPACLIHFPEIEILKTEHPILSSYRSHIKKLKSGTIKNYSVELKYLDKYYTQRAQIFHEYNVIRIFTIDITQQKQIEELIREKNKEITDSINYARRIQQAKLPRLDVIYDSIPQCFVLFKPKDIVSGDFYFFQTKNDLSYIAAADCTGHGVPGAFMSMIGSERLEDAVMQNNNVSDVLKQLNKGIKTSLRQTDSSESTRDGMDIAICEIDTTRRTLSFAGANRPIWIIRHKQNEIEEIKGTKKAIGGFTEDAQCFDAHEIKLKASDTFYLFTDGYADTFGGKKGKKLTTKRFKELLLSIQDKTMKEQEKHLEEFIEEWKAGSEQVDDILVIGIRL